MELKDLKMEEAARKEAIMFMVYGQEKKLKIQFLINL
jgi:hypothetical protein